MAFSRTTLSVLAIVGADLIVRLFFRETSGKYLIEGALMAVGIYLAYRFGRWDGPGVPTWARAPRVLTAGFLKQVQAGKRPDAMAQPPPTPSLQSLPTWLELEQRFRELHPALQFSRLDIVKGSPGEHFTVAGGPDPETIDRFKTVARMAGARLSRDFPDEIGRHKQLAQESDPLMLWYKALRHIGGGGAATVFIGTIDQPAAASANLCLTLATQRRNLQP